MHLLLDTHILLWAAADSPRLPSEARKLILNPEHELAYSAASLWEVTINGDRFIFASGSQSP